ncbi:hypothetical protein [Rhodopirellula europaea]|uniref:hypothetical protein n=1 Tax=Rhodopirellula europaea TaxID=1263866 RepID=UPI003D2BBA55
MLEEIDPTVLSFSEHSRKVYRKRGWEAAFYGNEVEMSQLPSVEWLKYEATQVLARLLSEVATILDCYQVSDDLAKRNRLATDVEMFANRLTRTGCVSSTVASTAETITAILYPDDAYKLEEWPTEDLVRNAFQLARDCPVSWENTGGLSENRAEARRLNVLVYLCPAMTLAVDALWELDNGQTVNDSKLRYAVAGRALQWRTKIGFALNRLLDCEGRICIGEKPGRNARRKFVLTDNDRNILEAMLELGATSGEHATPSGEILQRAGVPESGTVWENLRSNELVGARPSVGRWLTELGNQVATDLNPPRIKSDLTAN